MSRAEISFWIDLETDMKIVVFTSPEAKAIGALGQPSPLPVDYVLFFPNIDPGGIIHTRGMKERLAVFFLDASFSLIGWKVFDLGESFLVPARTVHVVETSVNAPAQKSFAYLEPYIAG